MLPTLLNDKNEEVEGEGAGMLCIKQAWPATLRTVYGDHERYETNYFKPFPGYYFSGDGCRRDADGYYWITGRVDDVINVSGHRIGAWRAVAWCMCGLLLGQRGLGWLGWSGLVWRTRPQHRRCGWRWVCTHLLLLSAQLHLLAALQCHGPYPVQPAESYLPAPPFLQALRRWSLRWWPMLRWPRPPWCQWSTPSRARASTPLSRSWREWSTLVRAAPWQRWRCSDASWLKRGAA